MTFFEAMQEIIKGRIVTDSKWNNTNEYCLINPRNSYLSIHKAGEPDDVLHEWLIHTQDMLSTTWVIK